MRTCPSCGGVIGRDCFNPQECASITAQEESNYRGTTEANKMTLEMLQRKFVILLNVLEKNGIDVSEVLNEPEIKRPVYEYSPSDDLPF